MSWCGETILGLESGAELVHGCFCFCFCFALLKICRLRDTLHDARVDACLLLDQIPTLVELTSLNFKCSSSMRMVTPRDVCFRQSYYSFIFLHKTALHAKMLIPLRFLIIILLP